MAIVQNPVIGVARNSAGGMIFSRSLDQNVMRAKPITYNDKKSQAQKDVRLRLLTESGLTKADCKKALDYAYPTRPTGQTKYSRFVQETIPAVQVENDVITIDFDTVQSFGNGSLSTETLVAETLFEEGIVSVAFNNGTARSLSEQRLIPFIFVFDKVLKEGYSTNGIAIGTNISQNLAIPTKFDTIANIAIYAGFFDPIAYNSTKAMLTETSEA